MPGVRVPAPDALVEALLRPGHPLAVLDPGWPVALRAAAETDLARGVSDGDLGDGDLVLFTSGSSGRPRGVVRTLGSWQTSLAPLSEVTDIGADDVVWLPGPLWSSLSLYGAFHAASVGAQWVTHDARRATAVHLVPTVLADLLEGPERVPNLRTVVVAGAALPEPVRAAATARGWRVVEYYGAAELSFVASREGPGPMRAFPGADVQVRDGAVWVRSPYLARGYLGARGGPLLRDGEWASVGDLARPLDDGFVVLGRGDAVVVTGGHTVVAEEVEAALAEVAGVQAVAVLGLPHERLGQYVVALVVRSSHAPASRDDLDRVVAGLPGAARPRRVLEVTQLPMTPAGKVARDRLAGLAAGAAPLR